MITIKRGDVLLAEFVYSDETGAKLRPMYVISCDEYNERRDEVIAGAVTSNLARQLAGDYIIQDWQAAGLLHPSTARAVLRTVDKSLVRKRIGQLTQRDLTAIETSLRGVLGL